MRRSAPGRRAAVRAACLLGVLLASGACGTWSEVRRPAALDVTMPDMDGTAVRLAEFRGRPLVINFWATWCVPCRREMPQLVRLADRHRARGLVVIGISVDDAPEDIRAFARAFGVTYPLLEGRAHPDAITALEYTGLLPTTVFVDREGYIVGRLVGPASDDFLDRRVQSLY